MIVLDASAAIELLTNGKFADAIRQNLAWSNDALIVPHLLDVEVASALRRMMAGQRTDPHQMQLILTALATLPAERYSHTPLLKRIWELRHNFTCYDAAYIALAEATNAVLYTSDTKLTSGHQAQVQVFA